MSNNTTIPTEPIGSIPRTTELIKGLQSFEKGNISQAQLDALYEQAIHDTIRQFEATGSPVITDGEQAKPSFATYPIAGLKSLAPDGVKIPFADGHVRQLPRLTSGPFRYQVYAGQYLATARKLTNVPLKQAVISASALSLLYPRDGIVGYSQKDFLNDLVREAETDIRRCLDNGAHNVQIDFTEGRLAVKLDPSKKLLKDFISLNNRVLERFSDAEREKIGVHTCPGGDQDSTHSADVDYANLIPDLFEFKAGNFYFQMASEPDRVRVLKLIKENIRDNRRVFVGVIDPINAEVETPETVRDRIIEASEHIPLNQLGTTDDCGFSPFGDDTSTARKIAFDKIRARIEGTQLAGQALGL